jgi:LmbE family N-acetylglucosaminyl deacetylase
VITTGWPVADGRELVVLGVGAHPDDLEIGCGATLRQLVASRPVRVHWLVLTGTPERQQEARNAAAQLLGDSAGNVTLADFADGHLPARWADVKATVREAVNAARPDLVFCPRTDDLHQDHRLAGELAWQTARQAMILEYEIVKWEGDLRTPNVYVPLEPEAVDAKLALLRSAFPSQQDKPWYDDELFRGLMRVRGVEAGARYAEGFHCRKVLFAP